MSITKGGYLMLELPGLDLTETGPQTIAGSYAVTKAAALAGKPIWLYGVEGFSTPIPAAISEGASSAYIISFLTYTATVATTSAVTVDDLTA